MKENVDPDYIPGCIYLLGYYIHDLSFGYGYVKGFCFNLCLFRQQVVMYLMCWSNLLFRAPSRFIALGPIAVLTQLWHGFCFGKVAFVHSF